MGFEEDGEVLGDALKDAFLFDALLKELSHEFSIVCGVLANGEERNGNAGEMLIEVGHVINEWQSAAIMDKAQAGDITK